jgi:hypothetical protein
VEAAPSRFDCLVKLGNNASKEDIESCMKGANPSISTSPSQVGSIDTGSEEAVCLDLGFKKKTPSYANCVLELLERKGNATVSNDPDDATCRKYGFKPKTNEYAACRQQIDQARSQAAQQQAQYLQQQRQYQAQLDEQQRQRSVAAGMALFQMGTGITSGAYNANNAYGTMPTPPNPNRTYILPGGKTMNCTTTGTVTNCF